MAIVVQGQDQDGAYHRLLCSPEGTLKSMGGAGFIEDSINVASATSTTGKIGTVVASATTIVAVDCTDIPVESLDWTVSFDNSWSYQLARANTNVLSATITLADATVVDDEDTFVLNGLTFTAEATEEDALAAERKFWTGANNAACAVNIAALITDATYGVPGITAAAAAVSATDVITIGCTTATCLQFAQGTSAANEIAWAETTKLSLSKQGAEVTGKTTTAAFDNESIQSHYLDGWGWGYIVIDNDEASTATLEVGVTRR